MQMIHASSGNGPWEIDFRSSRKDLGTNQSFRKMVACVGCGMLGSREDLGERLGMLIAPHGGSVCSQNLKFAGGKYRQLLEVFFFFLEIHKFVS